MAVLLCFTRRVIYKYISVYGVGGGCVCGDGGCIGDVCVVVESVWGCVCVMLEVFWGCVCGAGWFLGCVCVMV